MDLCESRPAILKHTTVETPRPPLVPAERNNAAAAATVRRLRAREVSSRFKSPTTSTPSVRRCPSPSLTRTARTPSQLAPKRAQSAERNRPSTPASPSRPSTPSRPSAPSRPSTPVHDSSVDTQLAPRKVSSGRLPEGLWPSTMRSLSVSFQSDSISIPVAKKEKSVSSTPSDRTLRPTSNGVHKQSETPTMVRKPTPERKRSPLKGKHLPDQSENSKPVDCINARLIDQHRWPSRTGGKVSLNASNSSSDLPEKITRVRSQSLPIPGSRLPSPSRTSITSSSVSRGASPSRTRPSTPPSRGISPSRIRPSNVSTQSSSSTSVLSFIVDFRKGKKSAGFIEDAHQLRLMHNRNLQWRFANARAEAVLHDQKALAEKTLFNVWVAMIELWDSVIMKSTVLQQMQLELKLNSIVNKQMTYLDEWASLEEDHIRSLAGAVEDLEASTVRLPVTGGARVDIESLKGALCSAVDVMHATGSSMYPLLSKVEEMNELVSELALAAARERAMLDQCETLLASTAAMQVEECSIRTHLLQLKQTLERRSTLFRPLRLPSSLSFI
ncbi:hypothetical protein NL676_034384 [Syzygium grande]|nr:hypothetical protein NL676_034384 [Syzygium grande]